MSMKRKTHLHHPDGGGCNMKIYKNEHKMLLPTKFSLFVKGLPHREFL